MEHLKQVLETKKNRWNMRESKNAIIGVEIRRKRMSLCYTLQSLCLKICSPSYLCKIERNQIEANQTIVSELLERMSISGEQKNMLFNFYDILLEAIQAFAKNDVAFLKKNVEIGTGFENYRYRILQLMYCLLINDLATARDINKEICDILNGMQDIDLLIFSVFSAILAYKDRDYKAAIDVLSRINGLFLSDELTLLRTQYLFLSSMMLGSYETQSYYHELIDQLGKLGYYNVMEESHFAITIFHYKTGAKRLFEESYKLLHNPIHKNSIDYLLAYMEKDYEKLHKMKKYPMVDFCKYLVDTLSGNEAKLEVIRHLSSSNDSYAFNSFLLKYWTYHSSEEKLGFIYKVIYISKMTCDAFVNEYFIKELTQLSLDKGHYKEVVRIVSEYYSTL